MFNLKKCGRFGGWADITKLKIIFTLNFTISVQNRGLNVCIYVCIEQNFVLWSVWPERKATFSLRIGSTSMAFISSLRWNPERQKRRGHKPIQSVGELEHHLGSYHNQNRINSSLDMHKHMLIHHSHTMWEEGLECILTSVWSNP